MEISNEVETKGKIYIFPKPNKLKRFMGEHKKEIVNCIIGLGLFSMGLSIGYDYGKVK